MFSFDFKATVIVLCVVRVEDGYFLLHASTGGAAVRLGLEARFLAVDAAGRSFPPGRALAPVFTRRSLGQVLFGGLQLFQKFHVVRVALPAAGCRSRSIGFLDFLGCGRRFGPDVGVMVRLISCLDHLLGLAADDTSGL